MAVSCLRKGRAGFCIAVLFCLSMWVCRWGVQSVYCLTDKSDTAYDIHVDEDGCA